MKALLLAGALLAVPPAPAPPLRVATGVAPETVTVGDHFRALIRVTPPAGATVTFAPLATTDTLLPVDTPSVVREPDGRVAASYPLVAWWAGLRPAASATVTVTAPDGTPVRYRIPLRLPYVRSVLPTDTAGVRPRPAKGLVALPVPARRLWPLWLGIALLLVLTLTVGYRLRRRRRAPPAVPPRERALARLDEILASDLLERGDVGTFYTAAVRVLRDFLATLDPRWAEPLTARELVGAMRAGGVPREEWEQVAQLLRAAEPVLFAGGRPAREEALRFGAALREWIASFGPPEAAVGDGQEAAA
ncbi:MAG TPA: hypothetical protein VFL93_13520 [Longimicrobiaceae bacterium]|nr:hypothetical protein [Longimicrobiaceae bacterium]